MAINRQHRLDVVVTRGAERYIGAHSPVMEYRWHG